MADANVGSVTLDIRAVHNRLAADVNAAKATLTSMMSGVQNILSKGFQISGISALAGSAGLGLLSKGAMDAASKFEMMTQTLTTLQGSADKAKNTMSWLEAFAGPSVFRLEGLQEATIRLEAFGLSAQRYLPVLSNLAGVFGNDSNKIMEVADALGRLKSGQSGEALEALRRFGISNNDLMAKGLQFNGGGQMISGATEAINAIEAIIQEKFGSMGSAMANTLGAKLGSVGDAWQRALRNIGTAFMPVVKEISDGISGAINSLSTSGTLSNISKSFASMIDPIKVIDGFKTGVSWLVAGIESLPAILQGFWEIMKNLPSAGIELIKILGNSETWRKFGTWINEGFGKNFAIGTMSVMMQVSAGFLMMIRDAVAAIGQLFGQDWKIPSLDKNIGILTDAVDILDKKRSGGIDTASLSAASNAFGNIGVQFSSMADNQKKFYDLMGGAGSVGSATGMDAVAQAAEENAQQQKAQAKEVSDAIKQQAKDNAEAVVDSLRKQWEAHQSYLNNLMSAYNNMANASAATRGRMVSTNVGNVGQKSSPDWAKHQENIAQAGQMLLSAQYLGIPQGTQMSQPTQGRWGGPSQPQQGVNQIVNELKGVKLYLYQLLQQEKNTRQQAVLS